MFKPMSRSAAHKPNVFDSWMPVNQKIPVPGILVLANARFHNRRPAQRRKAFLHKTPCFGVGKTRPPNLPGKSFPSHAPQAKTKCSASICDPLVSVTVDSTLE